MQVPERQMSSDPAAAESAFDEGRGVLRLAPTWVPRAFCVPGRRLRLHPDDYFFLGGSRGGVDERWLASAVRADNGPETGADEGMSFVVLPGGLLLALDAAIEQLRAKLIGERLWSQFGKWPIYSKFFDNRDRLPLHIHHRPEHAALVNAVGKPEAYYFPPQLNNHLGNAPITYFGLQPHVTRDQFAERVARFVDGDNHIIELSQAYALRPGTGWNVPAGLVHAPSSLCTYEPQAASDVYAMLESWTGAQAIPEALLWKDVPSEHHGDVNFIASLLDWQLNKDPFIAQRLFMEPISISTEPGYTERWVVYRSRAFSAKELTVAPGETAEVLDAAAYGCIAIQGHGTLGSWPLETPGMIRCSELTFDEYFVSEEAAKRGIRITNRSESEPLVLLKHFGPDNPDNQHADCVVGPDKPTTDVIEEAS